MLPCGPMGAGILRGRGKCNFFKEIPLEHLGCQSTGVPQKPSAWPYIIQESKACRLDQRMNQQSAKTLGTSGMQEAGRLALPALMASSAVWEGRRSSGGLEGRRDGLGPADSSLCQYLSLLGPVVCSREEQGTGLLMRTALRSLHGAAVPSICPGRLSVVALRLACRLGRMCGQKGAFTQSLGLLVL